MQIVSESWKNAHKRALLNESYVEVSFDIADPDALADASPSDNGAIYISDSSELTNGVDKSPPPYCTLEQNVWLLNGDMQSIPESDQESEGYVSDVLSDDTCVFSEKIPIITLDFSEVFFKYIPGITITWSTTYNEFATDFVIRAYKDDTLVAEKEITENRSVKSAAWVDIVDYNRIVIYVKKWCLPNHRARVEKVFVGINKVYTKTDLFSYTHRHSVSPTSTALPKNEIQFSIDNVGGEYNPYNKEGMSKYLTERQEVKTRYGLKLPDNSIEWIKGGTFYVSEWYAAQNGLTADFTARDLLEFMSAIYIDEHDLSSRSLYDLAEKVLIAANLPLNSDGTVKWVIDESLKGWYTTAPLPEDSLANCLQLIANAGLCVIDQDRDGILHIEHLNDTDTDYLINSSNSYRKSEITLSKRVKDINVKVYTYTKNDDGKIESKTTYRTTNVGEVGDVVTVDNPLITDPIRASGMGSWLATHLEYRMTLDSSWRADVRLDPLDIITNENEYNSSRVRMTEVEFKYNGAFRGTGKGKVI